MGILEPENDVEGEWRGEAYEAPRVVVRAGGPACETRDVSVDFARGVLPNAAREAGRDVFARTERRAEEDEVGMLYRATPELRCDFEGVEMTGTGGTTTQFFASSFSLGVGFEL
jgi:hypothetical protein